MTLLTLSLVLFAQEADHCDPEMERAYLSSVADFDLRQNDQEAYVRSVECLGEIGSLAGINVLSRILGFRRTFPWQKQEGAIVTSHVVTPLDLYPAARALAAIGKPAMPSLVEVLSRNEKDSDKSKAASAAIRLIYHYDRPGAYDFLTKTALTVSDGRERDRILKFALEFQDKNGAIGSAQ